MEWAIHDESCFGYTARSSITLGIEKPMRDSSKIDVMTRRQLLFRLLALSAVGVMGRPSSVLADDRPDSLIVSYNEDYAPYSWSEKGGDVLGILPDILAPLLAAVPGLSVRNAAYPWRRAQAVLQTADADAICTFPSEERKAYAHFGKWPVAVLRPELFFSRQHPRRAELERISNSQELGAFALVDLKGNQWAEQNLAAYPNVQWVGGHDSVFRMVMNGRADVHVSLSPIVTRWRLKKLGIQEGVVSRPAPFVAAEVPFHLGIRKTHPRAEAILSALDKRLASPAYSKQLDKVLAQYL